MKRMLAATLLFLATGAGLAQPSAPATVSLSAPETQTKGTLRVRSPSFTTQSLLASRYTAFGDNVSPALRWTPVRNAKSYVIITEDPDSTREDAAVHWLMWNIPAYVNGFAEGVPGTARLTVPPGAMQGKNISGSTGYYGPHPPGGATHHYHFQVFALDNMLNVPAGATRDQLLKAMNGHVLAKGDLVGQGHR